MIARKLKFNIPNADEKEPAASSTKLSSSKVIQKKPPTKFNEFHLSH